MRRSSLAIFAGIVVFVGGLIYFATRQAGVQCELCITYAGRTACRGASARTRKESVTAAVSAACAVIASGVTETVSCQQTPPSNLRCD